MTQGATSYRSTLAASSPSGKSRVNIAPYLFMLPVLLLVSAVSLYPIVDAIRLSFFSTRYMEVREFIGFENYLTILDTARGRSNIEHSLVYVFSSLAVLVPFSLLLASLLNRPVRFRRVFRTLVLIPWVISQTIAGLLWRWALDRNYGPFTDVIYRITGEQPDVLGFPKSAMAALVIVNVWLNYPYAVILFLAALQTIPRELYEAASIDGASAWVSFRRITLPLIKPTMMITAIILTLLFFNMVTLILMFTGGGPFSATEVLSLRAFKEGFQFFRIGLGAAFSVLIFIINVIFSLSYVKLLQTDVYT